MVRLALMSALRTWTRRWFGQPSGRARSEVNRRLRERMARSEEDWYATHFEAADVSADVVRTVSRCLAGYSGIDFARVLPADRIAEDLRFDEVCWRDWEMDFISDLREKLGLDVMADPALKREVERAETIGDLMRALSRAADVSGPAAGC